MPPTFAHSVPGLSEESWELLEVHSAEVAELAERFCGKFNAGAWGHLAGLWHDLGKHQPQFQQYIRGLNQKGTPHAWVGAYFAMTQDARLSLPLASAIAAHHGALANVRADVANRIPAGHTLIESAAQWKQLASSIGAWLPKHQPLPADAHKPHEPADFFVVGADAHRFADLDDLSGNPRHVTRPPLSAASYLR